MEQPSLNTTPVTQTDHPGHDIGPRPKQREYNLHIVTNEPEPHIPNSTGPEPSIPDSIFNPKQYTQTVRLDELIVSPELLRRFNRIRVPPTKFHDYFSYRYVAPHAFLNLCYAEALKSSAWRQAMDKEIQTLEANDPWTLSPLLVDKVPIRCQWVYKIKQKPYGSIERYKARFVTKGYTQFEGIDYHDIFFPTAKFITFLCLLALATTHSWSRYQLDVRNAFFHGYLMEKIYMLPPPCLRR
ncbi:cysteine-rich RLK (RECEPTOR-like protein kinase) 8 [Abeliophyllum distichum]|uniref:Cysteine-rich RLK (RECEPTOR-like protein kinase) 8 n=1 Tax=Abeliophyllum distichum TaxID=126358 RepID=A0ABD1Q461_9LAMI